MSDVLFLVQSLIHDIRGIKVMLDYDLAKLYQIETKALKQAVRRNRERFPDDFMFELSQDEYNSLKTNIRSQFVTLDVRRGKYPKYAPFAFTEQGVAMLSSVLKSDVAIAANIAIMRAFVKVREYLSTTSSLSAELKELRARVDLLQIQHEENLVAVNDLSEDVRRDIDSLCIAIRQLAEKIDEKKKVPMPRIGFNQQSANKDS
ncbi:MAG: ORF6N domain-containing protein [Bacteroidales bacterium]|nr:ORF6N domain-containing protein [Bacteroidales bacterium]